MNEVSAFRAFNSINPVPANITNSVGGRKSNLFITKNMSIEGLRTEEVCSMLQKIPNYNFPIFDFQSISSGNPLTILSHHLIVESGLLSRLGLPVEKFLNYVVCVETAYDPSLPCNY